MYFLVRLIVKLWPVIVFIIAIVILIRICVTVKGYFTVVIAFPFLVIFISCFVYVIVNLLNDDDHGSFEN